MMGVGKKELMLFGERFKLASLGGEKSQHIILRAAQGIDSAFWVAYVKSVYHLLGKELTATQQHVGPVGKLLEKRYGLTHAGTWA